MAISEKDVAYVARLARLALAPDEAKRYAAQFEKILGHMDELKGVATADVPPTSHTLHLTDVLRDDVVRPFDPAPLLAAAPSAQAGYYKVKKVLE